MKTIGIDECIKRVKSYAMQFEAEGKKNISEDLWVTVDYLKRLQEQPKTDWIPCEERLPEGKEADKILVTDEDGIMAVCYFLEVTKVFKVRWNGEEFQGAFAWQPLPTPYKKEGAE